MKHRTPKREADDSYLMHIEMMQEEAPRRRMKFREAMIQAMQSWLRSKKRPPTEK